MKLLLFLHHTGSKLCREHIWIAEHVLCEQETEICDCILVCTEVCSLHTRTNDQFWKYLLLHLSTS